MPLQQFDQIHVGPKRRCVSEGCCIIVPGAFEPFITRPVLQENHKRSVNVACALAVRRNKVALVETGMIVPYIPIYRPSSALSLPTKSDQPRPLVHAHSLIAHNIYWTCGILADRLQVNRGLNTLRVSTGPKQYRFLFALL